MSALIAWSRRPLEPLIASARGYRLSKLRHDMMAGLTVSVVEIPQAMAFALIAGVPAQYGIYTAIIQGFIGALFSSSDHLSTGPTNTQSLLVAATVARLTNNPELYIQLAILLTLLKGVIQLAFALARMGNLIRYVSQSVIVGYTAGAGVLIAVGQIRNFLGVDVVMRVNDLPGVMGTVQRLSRHAGQIEPASLYLGLISLGIVLGVRWYSKLIPGPLLAVVAGAVIVAATGIEHVHVVGQLPVGLPGFAMPSREAWYHLEPLVSGALALALLGMLESVAISKSIAAHTGQRISPNQEFLGQGVTNLVSSFLQCIPGSGSFSRSMLAHEAGGRTRFCEMFNSAFITIIFLVFAPWAAYIPLASLAAILFVIAYALVDWRYMIRVARTSRSDGAVCFTTFLAALLLPLQYAIYVGIFLNLMLYLRRASHLHMAEMVRTSAGPFIERPIEDRAGNRAVMFLQVEGDLFFGVADELQDRLAALASSPVRVFVIRLKRTHSIDATVLSVVERFVDQVQRRGGHVILCGIKPELLEDIRAFGLAAKIGENNVFETGFGIFTSAKRALARARQLLGSSLDMEGMGELEETEGWAYQI